MDETDPCLRCGYDLRGIPDSSACPECGLLAGRSRMPTDEVRHARPQWLRTVAIGTWLLIAAAAMPLALLMTSFLQESLRSFAVRRLVDDILPPVILPASAIFFTCGIFLITSKVGRRAYDEHLTNCKSSLRFMGMLLLVPAFLFADISLSNDVVARWLLNWLRYDIFLWLAITTAALSLPIPITLARFLRDMARRVSNRRLFEYCSIVGIGWTFTLAMLIAMVIGNRFHFFRALSTESLIISVVVMISLLFFGLWTLVILVLFARVFARASQDARASWALADLSAFNDVHAPPAAETPPATDHAKA